ncbi:DUF5753 domain-containing protein [Spirillospora sp. CA-294931]|uniref:DUF5753 domain-containing protein n=1 Tax=Spirillospora sp. CA-294931 TaxID=3240042 RepID=UPI003D8F56C6
MDIAGGDVSYDAIERVSGELERSRERVAGVPVERLPSSSIYDLLVNPHRSKPLQWRRIASLWAVLYKITLDEGQDVGRLKTLGELRSRFDGLSRESVRPASEERERSPDLDALPSRVPSPSARDTDTRHDLAGLEGMATTDTRDGKARRTATRQLLVTVKERRATDWWREYGDIVPDWFGPYLSLEPMLERLWVYAPRRIPGLLQSPAYARHVAAEDLPSIGAAELDRRVELRRLRQQVLRRPEPPTYWAVINKRALLDPAVPPAVRREQCEHLIAMVGYKNVVLQVVDPETADRILPSGPTTLMRFAESSYADAVYLEQREHALFLYEADDVAYFARCHALLSADAQEPTESIKTLLALLERLR